MRVEKFIKERTRLLKELSDKLQTAIFMQKGEEVEKICEQYGDLITDTTLQFLSASCANMTTAIDADSRVSGYLDFLGKATWDRIIQLRPDFKENIYPPPEATGEATGEVIPMSKRVE